MNRNGCLPLLKVAAICLLLIAAWLAFFLTREHEYLRIASPDGRYAAVVTYRAYETLLPALPGQSSDMPGFIRIEDQHGSNFGRIEVPMVWMARDLEWTSDGARLALAGEWKFPTREYRYRDSSDREVVKIAR